MIETVAAVLITAIVIGIFVAVLNMCRRDRELDQRRVQYNRWVKTSLQSEDADVRKQAAEHIMRVLKEGPTGEYRGPWEETPLPGPPAKGP